MSPLYSADRELSLLHPYLLSVSVGGRGEKGLPDQRRNLPSPSCREAMQCRGEEPASPWCCQAGDQNPPVFFLGWRLAPWQSWQHFNTLVHSEICQNEY